MVTTSTAVPPAGAHGSATPLERSRERLAALFAESPELMGALMAPSRWEKVIYYRKPEAYPDPRRPKGRPCAEPGWIFRADSQDARQLEFMREGCVPLPKFGVISDAHPAFNRYGPWGPILVHPDGPAAFPLGQLLSLRWFDADECPVPGSKFPQLRGLKIVKYLCPECSSWYSLEPHLLGRHLVVAHNYKPEQLAVLSQRWSLSFDKDYARDGRLTEVYDYTEEDGAADGSPAADRGSAATVMRLDAAPGDTEDVETLAAESDQAVAARHAAADRPDTLEALAQFAQTLAAMQAELREIKATQGARDAAEQERRQRSERARTAAQKLRVHKEAVRA